MTKTQAINMARDRVTIMPQGMGYVVGVFTPQVGTRVSHEMPYASALGAARARKLAIALELMGWESYAAMIEEDRLPAGARWESAVRAP